ncbi:cation diffusion facilitator family transporter [Sporosarcina jeotgali]|uniref:Cation diffusion facilitator family transporter n=1 Tax=Sporosarcina jeotgali TaxID=3020056 RepID=A0ABZ0KU04_9BACL|nr:cation diffusion facilitator family transporter [Sporosarcina sp. B2O-1]WOV83360.1 cation diffusion facilitator family transporter [Sporosarcina sp. B2O-1]
MTNTAHSLSSIIAIWVSLISNIFLTIMKIIVGYLFHSPVLLADGFHNAGDVVASAAALTSMRFSKRPPDEDHPYGHGKAEVISSALVGLILGAAAIYIAIEAIFAFFEEPHKASVLALITAIISMIWKQALYFYTMRIGRKENSKGLIATAYDHLADVYASLAAVIGIGLGLIGFHFDIPILSYGDPLAGLIVAILVMRLAIHIGKEALDILMEKTVSEERLLAFKQLIEEIPEVKRVDRLRAREHGHYVLVDIRISIPAELTIQQGHDVTSALRNAIKQANPDVGEVLIHVNPWYEEIE